jgi:hypothetical protein
MTYKESNINTMERSDLKLKHVDCFSFLKDHIHAAFGDKSLVKADFSGRTV